MQHNSKTNLLQDETRFISLDMGGTFLKVGILATPGHLLHETQISSQAFQAGETLASRLAELCLELAHRWGPISGMALGVPGLLEWPHGILRQSPHFPQWKDIPLQAQLSARLPFRVRLENDANKAALGEAYLGAGRDWPDFIMLTLGTGVGGAIVIHRQIFHGPLGFAGEFGHMTLERHGKAGALGIPGTLETLTSLSGLHLQCQEKEDCSLIDPWDVQSPHLPEELFRWAQQGNETAQKIWEDFGQALACGISNLAHILGIFRFIVGGGLSGAWEAFAPACFAELPRRLYEHTAKLVDIRRAQLGNQAGLFGAIPMLSAFKGEVSEFEAKP